MKSKTSLFLHAAAFLAALFSGPAAPILGFTAPSAHAATIYNAPETAIFGTGNPDTNWVESTGSGLTLDLRFRERFTTNMSNNGAGTYAFGLGTSVNVDWSGSSGTTGPLGQYLFVLSFDVDPSAATLWNAFPVALAFDNSYGTASTPNGGGVEGPFGLLAGTNTVFQNSWRTGQVPGGLGLDPNTDSTYDVKFTAYAANDTGLTHPLNEVKATLQFGNGAAPVSTPDGGVPIWLSGPIMLGMLGFGAHKKRRQ